MKHLIAVSLLLTSCAFFEPEHPDANDHPLAALATKVPVDFICPSNDGSKVRTAIAEYQRDREALRSKLVKQARENPVAVACLLLDARTPLQEAGEHGRSALREVNEGLRALGVDR